SGSGWIASAANFRQVLTRLLLFGLAAPVLTRTYGWFPGQRFGLLGDAPGRPFLTWARWCLSPGYIRKAANGKIPAGFAQWTGRLLMLSFTDDAMMTERAILLHLDNFPGANIEHRRIAPQH